MGNKSSIEKSDKLENKIKNECFGPSNEFIKTRAELDIKLGKHLSDIIISKLGFKDYIKLWCPNNTVLTSRSLISAFRNWNKYETNKFKIPEKVQELKSIHDFEYDFINSINPDKWYFFNISNHKPGFLFVSNTNLKKIIILGNHDVKSIEINLDFLLDYAEEVIFITPWVKKINDFRLSRHHNLRIVSVATLESVEEIGKAFLYKCENLIEVSSYENMSSLKYVDIDPLYIMETFTKDEIKYQKEFVKKELNPFFEFLAKKMLFKNYIKSYNAKDKLIYKSFIYWAPEESRKIGDFNGYNIISNIYSKRNPTNYDQYKWVILRMPSASYYTHMISEHPTVNISRIKNFISSEITIFLNSNNIKHLIVEGKDEDIGDNFLSNIPNLEKVVLLFPNLTKIGDNFLRNNKKLKWVSIKGIDSIESIGKNCIADCGGPIEISPSIDILRNFKEIGSGVLDNTKTLNKEKEFLESYLKNRN